VNVLRQFDPHHVATFGNFGGIISHFSLDAFKLLNLKFLNKIYLNVFNFFLTHWIWGFAALWYLQGIIV